MKRPIPTLATLTALVVAAAAPARAQQAPSDAALSEIATALTRIAAAMEKQLEGGRLELLMQRVDASQRRADRIDEQLRREQNYRDGQLQESTRLEQLISALEDPARAEAMGYDPSSVDVQIENLHFELEMTRRKIQELERKIAGLQSQKDRHGRDVEDWQAFIDRELAGMQ